MKVKKIELDVDYIGGQEPLTKEEEVALSTYIQSHRLSIVGRGASRLLKRKKVLF
jgi:hypothetical protein